jgi:adenylate cyclase
VPKIFSKTDNKTIETSGNKSILATTLGAGIDHTHVCGGNARCSTCRVYIMDGLDNCLPRNEKEQRLAHRLGFPPNIRLACQTKITGDITIRRPVIDDLDIEIILKQLGDAPGTQLGQETDLAILFTDIENYTQFAEAFPAYDVVHVLSRYYQTMNEIIENYKGIISDVMGDGILSLFGVLHQSENSVLDALNSVREMNRALNPFNDYLKQMYDRTFGIRAGIHFGKVIVGNFDTGLMSKITAIGDAVNLASRIETANKDFGTTLLISESANAQIEGLVETRKVYHTRLKGKSGEYNLYEIKI